jgi:hypothetical protein
VPDLHVGYDGGTVFTQGGALDSRFGTGEHPGVALLGASGNLDCMGVVLDGAGRPILAGGDGLDSPGFGFGP